MKNILIKSGLENCMPTDYSSHWLLAVVGIVCVNKAVSDKEQLMILTVFKHETQYYCTTIFGSLS